MSKRMYYKVACASPRLKVGDVVFNENEHKKMIDKAEKESVDVLLFPELSVTGYSCGDLFYQQVLREKSEEAVCSIKEYTKGKKTVVIVGAPVVSEGKLFNAAVVIQNGHIQGIVPKTFLPEYNEFYEKRWFESAEILPEITQLTYARERTVFGSNQLFRDENNSAFAFAIEICEDLWAPIPPSSMHALKGALLVLNPSASNELVGKDDYRRSLIRQQSARTATAYAYVSSGFGESTTDVVYGGSASIYENGVLLNEGERFSLDGSFIAAQIDVQLLQHERLVAHGSFKNSNQNERYYASVPLLMQEEDLPLARRISPFPFVPQEESRRRARCEEIFHIQATALAKRMEHAGVKSLVIGMSGGLDSTLAMLVCAKACDLLNRSRETIIGVTMPGFGTTDRTYNNAVGLIRQMGATFYEISIADAIKQHFKDIGHSMDQHDVVYENAQARERTQILMDLANKEKGMVVGTGDLSELALGWATYNGDHMSMYAVNSGVPKTLIRYLVRWVADYELTKAASILYDVLDTPVSPELLPPDEKGDIAQKTEEVVGPYELHDFFLYYTVRYGFSPKKIHQLAIHAFKNQYKGEVVFRWLKNFFSRFFAQQFKRSCMPDGPKVGSVNLSPRGDFRIPSDASKAVWMEEIEEIENKYYL